MPSCQPFSVFRRAFLISMLAIVAACGDDTPYDWKNREIGWIYGPTNATATHEHLSGAGKKGPGAVAKGWKCRLADARLITVTPFELSSSHALFGKVVLSVALFDKAGKQLADARSEVITADNAAFSFEIEEDVAKALYDIVIWYVGV